ncbi:DUF1963 domain-containing protein [Alcanivorax sp.]|uniref:DUF1963 domain-containing protein n=1 Tax=Alcanivorax sp. TaxID=1872427 RepID=UPI00263986BE|nr:DUF1963 domain-containing protein [Alcanivorax sp.]
MLPEEIKLKLAPLSRTAWRPRIGPAVPGARSKFGGLPLLRPDESWPCCGHCHQPMQLFVQLDSGDLPADAGQPFGDGVLQVFYCTNMEEECEVFCQAHLPFSEASLSRVIPRDQTQGFDALPVTIPDAFPEQSLTGWSRHNDFPDQQETVAINDDLPDGTLALLHAHRPAPRAGDKLLGWPHWVQNVDYPTCPCCQKNMNFVMQLDSTDTLPFWFGDYGCAYVFQCENHPEVMTMTWSSRG